MKGLLTFWLTILLGAFDTTFRARMGVASEAILDYFLFFFFLGSVCSVLGRAVFSRSCEDARVYKCSLPPDSQILFLLVAEAFSQHGLREAQRS